MDKRIEVVSKANLVPGEGLTQCDQYRHKRRGDGDIDILQRNTFGFRRQPPTNPRRDIFHEKPPAFQTGSLQNCKICFVCSDTKYVLFVMVAQDAINNLVEDELRIYAQVGL